MKCTPKGCRATALAAGVPGHPSPHSFWVKVGAPYAFDQESFTRFYPLAVDAGIPVAKPDLNFRSQQKRS